LPAFFDARIRGHIACNVQWNCCNGGYQGDENAQVGQFHVAWWKKAQIE